jgi:hypothetical protein
MRLTASVELASCEAIWGVHMSARLPIRFWVELAMGCISFALLATTLVMPDWIEVMFDLAPDGGDGSVEWGMSLTLCALAILFFVFARRTWRLHARLARLATETL